MADSEQPQAVYQDRYVTARDEHCLYAIENPADLRAVTCQQFMRCDIEFTVEFRMHVVDPPHVVPIEGAELSDRMPLFGLDERRRSSCAQHLAGGAKQAAQAQPVEALQGLQPVLPGPVGEQQLRRSREDFFRALVKPQVIERPLHDCMDVVDVSFGVLPTRGNNGKGSIRQGGFDDRSAKVGDRALRA
jgi:hypothetical protein